MHTTQPESRNGASRVRHALAAFSLIALLAPLGSPVAAAGFRSVDPPAPDGSRSVNLVEAGDRLLLSWIEPGDEAVLRFAAFDGESWSAARTVAKGTAFVVNRADVPELTASADGQEVLYAHWLETLGDNAHAYGVRSARSTDQGATWEPLGWLHDDESAVEHGFVSHALDPNGGARAFWLDGRLMPEGGDTELRAAALGRTGAAGPAGPAGPPVSVVLDPRVCECCSTDAVTTADGPLIVYRDRSSEEIRDISVVRWTGDAWSAPETVHRDGWHIEGCPVNGPAASAEGSSVAVAWYSAADQSPRVQVAFSEDAGAHFAAPIVIDEERPRGQVDVSSTREGAAVVWLRREGGTTEVVWRSAARTGEMGPVERLGPGAGARVSEYPKAGRVGDRLLVAWGEVGEVPRLRAVLLDAP